MKKIIIIILALFSMFSCYEDHSSLNTKLISPINIDLGITDPKWDPSRPIQYTLFTLDTLRINPIVYREGIEDSQLKYTWTIEGNLIEPQILGTNMTLEVPITLGAQSNAYKLIFDVEDLTTGIHAEQLFDIFVQTPFGSGLLVCDTKDNGASSDVSLIMGYNFTDNLKKEQTKISKDLFQKMNGTKFEGQVNLCQSKKYGTNRRATFACDNQIYRVDPFDFKIQDKNEEMFLFAPEKFQVSAMGYSAQIGTEYIVIDGLVYPNTMQQNNKKYLHYLVSSNMSKYACSHFAFPQYANGLAFDNIQGRIMEVDDRIKVLNSTDLCDKDSPFDPNQLSNYECKSLMPDGNEFFLSIVQEKNNGNMYALVMKQGMYPEEKLNGKPLRKIDLSACTNIKDAQFFALTPNADVFWYATKDQIYSVYYTTDNLIVTPEYTVNPGDQITAMIIWDDYQGKVDYTNPTPNASDKIISTYSKDRMLVIATENNGIGTIRTIAVAQVLRGSLEQDKNVHGEYSDNFGKITAIALHK